MERKRYEVEVVYREMVRYVVDAENGAEAERQAVEMWQRGEEGADPDAEYEWAELEGVHVLEVPSEEECGQDCSEVLRFLRDRELVIERLDEDAFNPTVHDAVSAEDVARHFGWKREGGVVDVPRAARALDRLCGQHRVVCFDRPRVRKGERGEIRLYCTPQHLERLCALLDDPGTEAAEPAEAEPAAT